MEGKESKDGEGKSFFFKRKASRKAHNAQEAPAQDNSHPSNNHLSASVKSSTLPSNRHSQNAYAMSPSPSGGIFSKLKRKLKIRSSRGKYDLKDIVPPTRMRRKSDDPNVMKEGREGDDDDDDLKITSSLKTPRRSHSDKEDVILIRKNKRVSVMCQSGDKEPEIIFSNAINSEEDESESFGEGGEEDPYATINSVKDEISEKFQTPDAKKKAEKLERDRTKARELLSKSMKESSSANGGIVASPVENVEDLYAKIKPKKKDSASDITDVNAPPVLGASLDAAEFNRLAEARLKSRLEPEYETLDDVRQRTSLMYDGLDDGYEDLSHDSSVFEESNPSIPVDPDYETLEDVKHRVEQSYSSSSSSKADTATTTHRQSASHYSRPFDSKSSKHSGSIKSTSLSSFSMSDRSPGEGTGGSKDSKLDNNQRESPSLKKTSTSQEKMEEADNEMGASSGKEPNQQTQKGPAPLASSIDTSLPAEESASSSTECIYDNPNVIIRKQMNRDSLSPLSPKSRRSSHTPSQKTPAEEELVEKLSSLLAPPLPLRNYMKDEVSRGAGSSRHSWASPSPKFWDMSESWHGSDFSRGDHLLMSTPSVDARQKMSTKSKSQELFEGASNVRKSSSRERPKISELVQSKEGQNMNDGPETVEPKLEVTRSVSPQVRIIPIIKSPAIKSSTPASGSEEHPMEISEMEAKGSQSVAPPFRIIPISLSPGSPTKTTVSSSSVLGLHESSKDQSERIDLDKGENDLILIEPASVMQTSISEEITEANDSADQEMLTRCHQKLPSKSQSEETMSLAVKNNVNSVGEEQGVCSKSQNVGLLCNSTRRECNSDEKVSSFISSAIMELQVAGLDQTESENNTGSLSSGKARISTIRMHCNQKGNGATDKEPPHQCSQKLSDRMDAGQSSTPDMKPFRYRGENQQNNRDSCSSDSSEMGNLQSNASESCTDSGKSKRISSSVYDSVKVEAELKPSLVQSESDESDAIDEIDDISLYAKKRRKRCCEHKAERALVRQSVEKLKSLGREIEMNSSCRQVESGGSHPKQSRYLQHPATNGHQSDHHSRPLNLDIQKAGAPLCSDLFLPNHAQAGARPRFSPSSSRTSSSASQNAVSLEAKRYANFTESRSSRLPPQGREQFDLDRAYAQLNSDNDSDPLGDLEQYDENAPGLYPSDSSDEFLRSRQLDPPQMDYMRRHHKKRTHKVEARSRHSRYHRSDSFSDYDDDFEDGHDLAFVNRDLGPDRRYLVKSSSKSKDPYPYNCYKLRDFENLPPFKDVEFDIQNILLGKPILLENIINGHFCPFVGLNPYYFIRGSFEWSRIFALPREEMRRVEKKLCVLFNRIQALLHRGRHRLPREGQTDQAYWSVVDYLKKVQDQPTFNNIRIHLLGTDELLRFASFFRNYCALPQILDRFMKIEDFRVNEEEFKISREAAPTDDGQDNPRLINYQNNGVKVEKQQELNQQESCAHQNEESPKLENPDDSRQAQEKLLSPSQLSPSFGGCSLNLLTDFLELCDNHKAKISSGQDNYDSDEEEEEETVETYKQTVAISFAEARHYSFESAAAIMSLCRAFRGELAYTAQMRRKGKGNKKLASWTCSGMDSHLSFSAWEEMDRLMKKLVPHISPRLDFQYLLRLYAEFKFFVLKDRQRNKQCRGCFFVDFESGVQCCKKEEFVFLKLLRDELCYFSHLIRGCVATKSLFLEEHSVVYSVTRLLTLILETLWKMNQSMMHHPVDKTDKAEIDQPSDPTEPFSSLKDFDYHHERIGPWNTSIRAKIFFHTANYKAFRTSSMWHDLQAWQQPSDFLDDPNLLQGNSSVFTHADNAIHVAHFGGYEDLKPLHEREGFTESMQQLRMKEWYWGPLSYEQAMLVLKDHKDGTFLVRDSSDKKYLLSLSFISLGEVHHTRIEHAKGLFSFWSQPESHTKGSICEFIDISVQNSKDGRFLYFLRPNDRGTPPIPIRLLYPLSRNFRVPSLKHLSRFMIRQSVRIDHIKRLPLPQKVKAYLLEKQYFVEILMDDNWAFEREGSVSV